MSENEKQALAELAKLPQDKQEKAAWVAEGALLAIQMMESKEAMPRGA